MSGLDKDRDESISIRILIHIKSCLHVYVTRRMLDVPFQTISSHRIWTSYPSQLGAVREQQIPSKRSEHPLRSIDSNGQKGDLSIRESKVDYVRV